MPTDGWTRRRLLRNAGRGGVALVVLAGAGYGGYSLPHPDAAEADAAGATDPGRKRGVEHFRSEPDLHPPRLSATHDRSAPSERAKRPRYLFLAPKGYTEKGPGQQGPLIVDWHGRPVWFLPTPGEDSVPMNFRTQRFKGDTVLTWWQGTVPSGHGEGECLIYDKNYQHLATVRAGNGLQADLHEFLLTGHGTALITAYRLAPADLSGVGGPRDGWVFAGAVQEIDVDTGEVRFEWDSLDHVAVDESEMKLSDSGSKDKPFDYIHLNSIDVADDGDLVISARNTWTVYKISRRDGRIAWRMGGKKSDFHVDSDARYYWQHDARVHSENRISLFDNGSSPPEEKQSRGLVLSVDHEAKRVSVRREFRHRAGLLADNQGSLQLLPGGMALVGWGAEPYVSLFDADGTMEVDARFPANDQSYRAFAEDWVGTPTDPPAVALGSNDARGVTVYVSWNGATEVRKWRILAGKDESALAKASTVQRHGFETAIAVASKGPHFVAVALDRHGRELGRSPVVTRKQ